MLEKLGKQDFDPLVGQKVKVTAGALSGELAVAETAELASPSPRSTKPFRIILRSREDWRAPQGIFRVEHPTLGALDMFAVPIGPDSLGWCYEIVFN